MGPFQMKRHFQFFIRVRRTQHEASPWISIPVKPHESIFNPHVFPFTVSEDESPEDRWKAAREVLSDWFRCGRMERRSLFPTIIWIYKLRSMATALMSAECRRGATPSLPIFIGMENRCRHDRRLKFEMPM